MNIRKTMNEWFNKKIQECCCSQEYKFKKKVGELTIAELEDIIKSTLYDFLIDNMMSHYKESKLATKEAIVELFYESKAKERKQE